MKTFWISIVAYIALASTGAAEVGDIYDCKFKVARDKFIADQVIVGVARKSKVASVYDGIIHSANGEPIEAKILQDDDKRYTIRWQVTVPNTLARDAKLTYKLVYFKTNKKAVISMSAPFFEQRQDARGNCTIFVGNI